MKCVECAHPLRPRRKSLEDYPGTREKRNHGRCTSCSAKRTRAANSDGTDETISPSFDLGLAQSALDAYLADRRRRRTANGLAA